MALAFSNFASSDTSQPELRINPLPVPAMSISFLQYAKENSPDIIGSSGLIRSAYDFMRETIKLLHDAGCQSSIVIGGSLLNEEVFKYTNADCWVTHDNTGLQLCKKLVQYF